MVKMNSNQDSQEPIKMGWYRRFFQGGNVDPGNQRMIQIVLMAAFSAAIILAIADIDQPVMVLLSLLALVSLWLNGRGFLFAAGMGSLLSCEVVFIYLIFRNLGLRDTAILGLPLLIIAASLLIGRNGSLFMGIINIIVITGLGVAETRGWIHNPFIAYNTPADYATVCLGLILFTSFQWFIIRRLDNHIDTARQELLERQRTVLALNESEARYRVLNEELEKRVNERTAQLASANAELESFAYTVSHDLRAPLRAINGYASLLSQDLEPSLDQEQREFLGKIRISAMRMDDLISALLKFSRLSLVPLVKVPVSSNAIVEQLIAELQPANRSVEWRVADLPDSLADPALLRQIYANLIGNAIKYSAIRQTAVIEITGQQNGREVCYCVRDNGTGFDMRYASQLFGVFQRLHLQGEFEGTGIGLAIVKRIVERHGGRVWCEAFLDQGASFYFTLPVENASSGA